MSGRDIERDLREFFRDTAAPEPSERLRAGVAAARLEWQPGRFGRGGSAAGRLPRLAFSLAGLAASAILAGGLLLAVAVRPQRTGIAASASVEASGPASPGVRPSGSPAGTASPSATAAPTVTPAPTPRPSIPLGPSGVFRAAAPMDNDYTMAAILPDGRVLVVGGAANDVTSAELFDPYTGRFSRTGSMAGGHNQGSATVLQDGRVLILWGIGADGPNLHAEIYDPSAGTFSLAGTMLADLNNPAAVLLPSGRVLVVGAVTTGDTQAPAAELYDPATRSFRATGNPTTVRITPTATLLGDGRVLVAGGSSGCCTSNVDPHPLASTEFYDEATGTFTAGASMKSARAAHTATLLPSGRVLMVGGSNGLAGTATAEVFDPVAGQFSLTGSMSTDRAYHSATLLPDGRVLVAGGFHNGGPVGSTDPAIIAMTGNTDLASAEIYDPRTGKFTRTGSMTSRRWALVAVLLQDGRVLIVGGGTSSGGPMATTELYRP